LPVIAVVNRKGGSGKSTLATHLAGYLANRGLAVMLGDADRQQSTVPWLRRRAARTLPATAVIGRALDPRNVLRPPARVSHVVIDTPGALQGFDLARILVFADAVLVPVCNSAFDRESAAACLAEIRGHPRVTSGRCKVGALGMRIDSRTTGQQLLQSWAEEQGVALVGVLREAQIYVRCVERGLTIFDLPAARVQTDLEQWQPILQWLGPLLEAPTTPTVEPRRSIAPARTPGVPRSPAMPTLLPPVPVPAPTPTPTHTESGLRRLLAWLWPARLRPRAKP
jgi:chromosome partitioning protein